MITNNFNKELRGISDALRDLGYTDSTIGLRQRYWKEYCVYHGNLTSFIFYKTTGQSRFPGFAFLYVENHSLGEWFKRRLMSIMGKEKLPLLYWKCGLRTAQASKGRTFENERRK